jgi:hypothetical protein
MKVKVLLLLLLISLKSPGQDSTYTGERLFNADQIRSDFNILTTTVKNYHPACYLYITKDSLDKYIETVSASLNDSMTDNEFHLITRRFLALLHCGHTVAKPSDEWYTFYRANAKFLPFEVLIVDDRLYIKESLAKNVELPAGTEILAIDNIPSAVMINEMKSIQQRDALTESFVYNSIQKSFRTFHVFLYGAKPFYHVTYKNDEGEIATVEMEANAAKAKPQPVAIDTLKYTLTYETNWSELYIANDTSHTAYLDIRNFDSMKYRKYYKRVFQKLKKENISNLIIDMRDNGGGYFPNACYLLRHLMDENLPFIFYRPVVRHLKKQKEISMGLASRLTKTVFNLIPDRDKNKNIKRYEIQFKISKKKHYYGGLYLIVNGGSFSMSSAAAAYLKYKSKAVLVGEETGGGEEGSNAVLLHTLVLPNTKINVFIPYYHVIHKFNEGVSTTGVMPDVKVNYTLEERLRQKDKELEEIMRMIEKQK